MFIGHFLQLLFLIECYHCIPKTVLERHKAEYETFYIGGVSVCLCLRVEDGHFRPTISFLTQLIASGPDTHQIVQIHTNFFEIHNLLTFSSLVKKNCLKSCFYSLFTNF